MKKIYFVLLFAIFSAFSNSSFSQNDLSTGAFWGYQGWHLAPKDGRQVANAGNQWEHWFNVKENPVPEEYGIEMHPDVSEYNPKYLYASKMQFSNGDSVKLYSNFNYETVDLHIKWMKEYGIKGIFLQRQQLNIHNQIQREFRDEVLRHVIAACNNYGVKFCLMLANNNKFKANGQPQVDPVILEQRIKDDYDYLLANFPGLFNDPMYAKQNGKPVVALWGLGFQNRPITPSQASSIIDYLKDKDTNGLPTNYVMGGVPPSWRSNPQLGWASVFTELDMISPWRALLPGVGTTDMTTQIARLEDDLQYLDVYNNNNSHQIDYNPVVTPGASSATQSATGGSSSNRNWQPRDGGNLLWKQIYEAYNAGAKFIYGAMFDEVDEATAIYKMAKDATEIPINTEHNGTPFNAVTLDEDGYALPNDWYLQLAGESDKMLAGGAALNVNIPIQAYLDVCDDLSGWISDGDEFTRNIGNKKQGDASLRFKGLQTGEFRKVFSPAINTNISATDGMLKFYYFIGNVNKYSGFINVDLGSGGGPGNNRVRWQIPKSELQNGWNAISLKISDVSPNNIEGSIDMNAINFFRIYAPKTDGFVTRIDGLRLINYCYNGTPNAVNFKTNSTTKTALSTPEIANSVSNIYPNPFTNTIFLTSDKVINSVSVTDLLGKRVLHLNVNTAKTSINLSNIKSGLYIISLKYNDGTVSKDKILKQ